MYKKAWSTCKVVVLRNKLIAFLTSCLPSPSSLLKLPIDTFRRSSVLFETPACYHSNDRYLTINPINVMCYRCILSTPNLNFILVTKTPMNERQLTTNQTEFSLVTFTFLVDAKVKESPPHEMVLSTQALNTMTLVCLVSLLLSLND